jgi:hypothetical protein
MGLHATYLPDKGYMVDKAFPSVYYMPENVTIELSDRTVTYTHPESLTEMKMKVRDDIMYILPNGY